MAKRNFDRIDSLASKSGTSPCILSPMPSLSKTKEAIARGNQERPVWILTKKHLMKWNVNLDRGEECEFNQDITKIVTDAIFDGAEGNRTSLDIELFDVSINTSSVRLS